MPDRFTARGYTSVILVMNMRQFIAPEHQPLFASVRGSEPFSRVLREDIPKALQNSPIFTESYRTVEGVNGQTPMSADETGFVTGVFRQNMLSYYSAPDYKLQKSAVEGEYFAALRRNWQFKKLFDPVWKQWDIYIRPTMTGMLVIRLTRRYDKATPLLTVAHDVIKLQTSFDIHRAIDEFDRIEVEFKNDPATLKDKRKSVDALLKWLGVDPQSPPLLRYAPVQWKLAMEVGRYFVREISDHIMLEENGHEHIRFQEPERGLIQPIHDSFVIYHMDEFLTKLSRTQPYTAQRTSRVVVPEDFVHSRDVRQHVTNLLEGSMLRKPNPENLEAQETARYFPVHVDNYVEKVLHEDTATWDDELCLFSSRTAIVIPSRRAAQSELYISTLPTTPGSTVMYAQYWEALERMIEFVVEIRVLAQLLERASEDILQEFTTTLRRMREDMLNQSLYIDRHRHTLTDLVNESANLSRLASVCQSMSNPQVWSRAEYGADKADYLLNEMRVSVLLGHTERNVNGLTALVNHIDELYLAGLSENNNRETFWLSLILAALSLSIILFSLPSFWADVDQLNPDLITTLISGSILPTLTVLGSVLAPFILLLSLSLMVTGVWRAMCERRRHRRYSMERSQRGKL
jgi:hypothetical protein